MKDIVHRGYSFGDSTDWFAKLAEVTREPGCPSWLRSDIDIASALGEFATLFKGTPAWERIADAAMRLIETGSPLQREGVWQLPWEDAVDAVGRMLKLVDGDRARLVAIRGVPNAIFRLLGRHRTDPRVLGLLRTESEEPVVDPWISSMAAEYLTP